MKEKIEIFKKIWSVPRYKALIKLSLYFIFFASIIIYSNVVSKRSNQNEKTLTPLEKMSLKENYNFTINTLDVSFTGNKTGNIIQINYNDKINSYDLEEIDNIDFKYKEILEYLDLKKIYNLIKDEEFDSKTEFKDGIISLNYKLDNLEITTYENNRNIIKLEIQKTNKYEIIFE